MPLFFSRPANLESANFREALGIDHKKLHARDFARRGGMFEMVQLCSTAPVTLSKLNA